MIRRMMLLAALGTAACDGERKPPGGDDLHVQIKGRTLAVRTVAATEKARRKATETLPRLDEHEAHLLAWPRARFMKIESEAARASFDVAFLDAGGAIVDRQRFHQGDREGLVPQVEAAYALFVAPGVFDKLKAGARDRVEFSEKLRGIAPQDLPSVTIDGVTAHAELALNLAERNHGLMFRPRMSEDDGMLFAYSDEDTRAFWMGNCFIPLDIAFFRADGTLVNVNPTPVYADPRNPPANYATSNSDGPARYVLEMNLGWFRKKGLVDEAGRVKPGARAVFPPEAARGSFSD